MPQAILPKSAVSEIIREIKDETKPKNISIRKKRIGFHFLRNKRTTK